MLVFRFPANDALLHLGCRQQHQRRLLLHLQRRRTTRRTLVIVACPVRILLRNMLQAHVVLSSSPSDLDTSAHLNPEQKPTKCGLDQKMVSGRAEFTFKLPIGP